MAARISRSFGMMYTKQRYRHDFKRQITQQGYLITERLPHYRERVYLIKGYFIETNSQLNYDAGL